MAKFRGDGRQILGLLCYPLFRCCNRRLAVIVGHALDGTSGLTCFDGGELAGAWSENDDLQGVPLCIEQMLAIGPFEVNWGGIDDSLTGNIEHCGFLSREGCTNPPRHPRCAGRTDARSEEHTSELQSLMRIAYD